jgi:hypothetical protein
MRKRLVRALVFIAVTLGVAAGAANAAGAADLSSFRGGGGITTDGMNWD